MIAEARNDWEEHSTDGIGKIPNQLRQPAGGAVPAGLCQTSHVRHQNNVQAVTQILKEGVKEISQSVSQHAPGQSRLQRNFELKTQPLKLRPNPKQTDQERQRLPGNGN